MIEYKKSSSTIIFNDEGELALQLRAAHDDSFPSHWDFGAGGGIDEGEDEKDSAEREIREELGVEAKVEFVTNKHCTYEAWRPGVTREVDLWIYRTKHNGPFVLDRNEIEKVEFFTLEEIQKMIETGDKFHPEFVAAWKDGIIRRAS